MASDTTLGEFARRVWGSDPQYFIEMVNQFNDDELAVAIFISNNALRQAMKRTDPDGIMAAVMWQKAINIMKEKQNEVR